MQIFPLYMHILNQLNYSTSHSIVSSYDRQVLTSYDFLTCHWNFLFLNTLNAWYYIFRQKKNHMIGTSPLHMLSVQSHWCWHDVPVQLAILFCIHICVFSIYNCPLTPIIYLPLPLCIKKLKKYSLYL